MSLVEDIEAEAEDILAESWNDRKGYVVPTMDDVVLRNGAVRLDATMLYADLAESTRLAIWNRKGAAKVFKCYLAGSARIIKHRGGIIRSFDGDRIMAVFVGDRKNTNAARCALNINWLVLKVLRPLLAERYAVFKNGIFTLRHAVGVDTSSVLVVRAGVRIDNDLVWVGRAPNIAAKLSSLRNGNYASWITEKVYNSANDSVKTHRDGRRRWQRSTWAALPAETQTLYRSTWWWKP